MYIGDAPTAHTHTLTNVTDVTMTAANLNSLDDGVNSNLHFHNTDRDRANHTGTQLASTISDLQTAITNNTAVVANTAKNSYPAGDATKVGFITITQAVNLDTLESDTVTNNAKVTNATHTGEVTGATALTIANDVVTNAKLANVATSTIKGRVTASTGDPEDLTATQVRTLLNIADGATANTGTVTSVGITPGTGISVSGSPITGAGNITVTNSAPHVATNIAQGTRTSTTVPITSSTGTSATLNAADTSLAGVMSAADKTKLNGIATNANNYNHPNHTGDVTSTGDGATIIAANAVTNAKMATMPTKTYKGNTTGGAAVPTDVPVATLKADLILTKSDVGLSNVNNTSDINKPISTLTQTALNAKANTVHTHVKSDITDFAHTHPQNEITNLVTDLGNKQATLVSGTNIKTINSTSLLGAGDIVIGGADPTKLAILNNLSDLDNAATARTNIGLATTANQTDSTNKRFITDAQQTVLNNTSGTNTGDQSTIVGITGTKAQFDTAVTDGNFMYIGDAPTAHTHTEADITDLGTYSTDIHANIAALNLVSGTNTGDNAVNTLYSGLVSNATHTGEVIGTTSLTVDKTAITNKTTVTAATDDLILIADASNSDNLKKVTAQSIADLAGIQPNRLYLNTAIPTFTPSNVLDVTKSEVQIWVDSNLDSEEKKNTELYYNIINEKIFDDVIHYPETVLSMTSGLAAITVVLDNIVIDGVTTPVNLDLYDIANYSSINSTINAAILAAGYTASGKLVRTFTLSSTTSGTFYLTQSSGTDVLTITFNILKDAVNTVRTLTNTPIIDYQENLYNGTYVWSVINGQVEEVRNDYKDFNLYVSARGRVPAFNAAIHKEGTIFIDTEYDSHYRSDGTQWINYKPEVSTAILTPHVNRVLVSDTESYFSVYINVKINTFKNISEYTPTVICSPVPLVTQTVDNTDSVKSIYNGFQISTDQRHITTEPYSGGLLVISNDNNFNFNFVINYTPTSSNNTNFLNYLPILRDKNNSFVPLSLDIASINNIRMTILGSGDQNFLPIKSEKTLPRLASMTTAQRDTVVTLNASDTGKTIFNTTSKILQVWDGAAWAAGNSFNVTQKTGTLTTGAWSLVSGLYEQDYADVDITASSVVDIIPNNADIATVKTAEVLPRTDSSAGSVKVYATNLPGANIGITLNIFK
jgi:frataxin-like iron-binding protein CyaY